VALLRAAEIIDTGSRATAWLRSSEDFPSAGVARPPPLQLLPSDDRVLDPDKPAAAGHGLPAKQ
jgi:hypothetical protein